MRRLFYNCFALSALMALLASFGAASNVQATKMPPTSFFEELHRTTKPFNTKKVTERIQMPDNFFERLHNASAEANMTFTKGHDLSKRRRRLNSEFCGGDGFSDISEGFVWMGNDELAEHTDYDSYWQSEPYFESDTVFIVHNSPQSNMYYADELCIEVIHRLKPIEFNYPERRKELRPNGVSGFVCDDCYAHAGAHALAGVRCVKESHEDASSTYCDVEVSAGGSFGYNLDLKIDNPKFNRLGTSNIWKGRDVPLRRISKLFAGFGISLGLFVKPRLDFEVRKLGEATGRLYATASAQGELTTKVILENEPSLQQKIETTSGLRWKPLELSGTDFSIDAGDVHIVIIPVLDFSLQLNFHRRSWRKSYRDTLLQVNVPISFPVEIAMTDGCRASYKMFQSAKLDSISSPVLDWRVRLNVGATRQVHHEELNFCVRSTASVDPVSTCYDSQVLNMCKTWGKSSTRGDGCEAYARGWPAGDFSCESCLGVKGGRNPCSRHECHALCEEIHPSLDKELRCKSGCDRYMSIFQNLMKDDGENVNTNTPRRPISVSSQSASALDCEDPISGWSDSNGDTCENYASHFTLDGISWCDKYGEDYASADGATANMACCACQSSNEAQSTLCEETCFFSKDGQCDDGGEGFQFDICGLGTDCQDCGSRTTSLSPAENQICEETCIYSKDHQCDDGGDGSEFDVCELGSDCGDCGLRERTNEDADEGISEPRTICDNSCPYSEDGECDDGGADAHYDVCMLGTDCVDCGPRDANHAGMEGDGGGVCEDTCVFAHDNQCDDGGVGSSYDICAIGTDCTDCGDEGSSGSYESSYGWSIIDDLDPDAGGLLCENACEYHDDGDCDDGGMGSSYTFCAIGTDCADCGIRGNGDENSDPDTGELCENTCEYHNDGDCDDGGVGSLYNYCVTGTDCADCGGRSSEEEASPTMDGECDDACTFNGDGECDDGGFGSHYDLCSLGSDCQDCGTRAVAGDDSDGSDVEGSEMCTNECAYNDDGDCDDGGPGANYHFCEYGTDCNDCKTRVVRSHGACELSCNERVSSGTSCNSTWTDICGDEDPPADILVTDTLSELCPTECQEHDDNSCSDLQIGSNFEEYNDFCTDEVSSYMSAYRIHTCAPFVNFGFSPEDVDFLMTVCPQTCGNCHQIPVGTIVLTDPVVTQRYDEDSFRRALEHTAEVFSSAIQIRSISMELTLNLQSTETLSSHDENIILLTCAQHLRVPEGSCATSSCYGCQGSHRQLESGVSVTIVASQGIDDPTMGSIVQNFDSTDLNDLLIEAGISASSVESGIDNIKLSMASSAASVENLQDSLANFRMNLVAEGVQVEEAGLNLENEPQENGPDENDPQENGPDENDPQEENGPNGSNPQESGPGDNSSNSGIIIGTVCGVIATAAVVGSAVFASKKVKLGRAQQRERTRSVEMPVKGEMLESSIKDKGTVSFENIALEVI